MEIADASHRILDSESAMRYTVSMKNNDVQISGSGRSFQLAQRRRKSRAFKVRHDEALFITLPRSLWGIFDWMKSEFGVSDYELVLEHSDLATTHNVTNNHNFLENLQFAIETMLQLHRSELHQSQYCCAPANDDSMHDLSHLTSHASFNC